MTTEQHIRPTDKRQVTTHGATLQAITQDHYGEAHDVLRLEEIDRPNLMRILGFGLRRPKQPNPGRTLAGT